MNNTDHPMEVTPKPVKLREFDVLRAVAILLLFVSHSEVLSRKFNGVSIEWIGPFIGSFLLGSFYFIAGYFVDASLSRRDKGIFAFFKSKFVRIYPPYLLAVILFVVVLDYTLKRRDWAVYLLNLQFIFSPAFVKQLLTLWYISVLMGFYIVYAFLFVRTNSGLSLYLGMLVVFALVYLVHIKTELFDGRFLMYLPIFTTGIYLSRNRKAFEWFFSIPFVLSLAFALPGLLSYWYVQAAGYGFLSWQHLAAVDFYILSSDLFWLKVFRGSISSWKIWAPISTASFFAYLYHRPIWEFVAMVPWGILSSDIVWVRLLPGSVIVIFICYYLQLAYNYMIHRIQLFSWGGGFSVKHFRQKEKISASSYNDRNE